MCCCFLVFVVVVYPLFPFLLVSCLCNCCFPDSRLGERLSRIYKTEARHKLKTQFEFAFSSRQTPPAAAPQSTATQTPQSASAAASSLPPAPPIVASHTHTHTLSVSLLVCGWYRYMLFSLFANHLCFAVALWRLLRPKDPKMWAVAWSQGLIIHWKQWGLLIIL